jgi:hypothetical protein
MEKFTKNYKKIVISSGLSSIKTATSLLTDDKETSFIVLNTKPSYESEARGFKLYPYERPIFLDDTKDGQKVVPLTIVTPNSRFEYHTLSLEDEIKKEFPDSWKKFKEFRERINILAEKADAFQSSSFFSKIKILVKDFRSFYDLYFRDIQYFYSSYNLSLKLSNVLDSMLFVFSGVLKKRHKVLEAVKILTKVEKGLVLPEEGSYSLRSQMIKELQLKGLLFDVSDELRLRKNKRFYEIFEKSFGTSPLVAEDLVQDYDHKKECFVKELDKVKGAYSEEILYPYSVYIKLDNELLNRCIGRFCMFIYSDEYKQVDEDNVLLLTTFRESEWYTILRFTCFMSYESKDINNVVHKERSLNILKTLKKLIPSIDIDTVDVYPDYRSSDFEFELNKLFANIGQSDLVYRNQKPVNFNNGGVKIEKI